MARGRPGLEDDGDCQLAVGALMDSAEAPFAALGSVLSRFALRSGQTGAVLQPAVAGRPSARPCSRPCSRPCPATQSGRARFVYSTLTPPRAPTRSDRAPHAVLVFPPSAPLTGFISSTHACSGEQLYAQHGRRLRRAWRNSRRLPTLHVGCT